MYKLPISFIIFSFLLVPSLFSQSQPIISQPSGSYTEPFQLSLSADNPIFYTVDGREPTIYDLVYQAPILIHTSMTLRAISIDVNSNISDVSTAVYLINTNHTFPIVYLAFDPFDFYDPETGIYVNYLEDWDRPADVTLFETDGSIAFSQPAKVEIQGSASAEFEHKSISIKAKKYNDEKLFDYAIFEDLPFEKYGSFTIRNAGQDWNKLLFRDAYGVSLVGDLSDVGNIIDAPQMILQGYRPAIGYFNGAYRGIYNIRERLDKRYFKTHFGWSKNDYDLIKNVDEVKSGDIDSWNAYMAFIDQNDMNNPSNYDSLQKVMDVDAYIDYIALNVFINNHDWPGNNIRRYREKSSAGKWRWMVYDLDFSFSLFNEGGIWDSGDFHDNALARLHNGLNWQWPNPEWGTRPFRACIQNDTWRTKFINRMADQLNILYAPSRLASRLDEFVEKYEPEITAHQCKWFSCWDDWDNSISKVENFISGRAPVVREHIANQYSEITGMTTVTLSANPINGGSIEFNTINLLETHFPWTGIYFAGVDIPVVATPAPGYEFVGWSNPAIGTEATAIVNLQDVSFGLTAIFQLISNTESCGTLSGYTKLGELNNHGYYLSEASSTWVEASTLSNGRLISIETQEENDFLQSHVSTPVFIGLNDELNEGNPVWLDGTQTNFSNISNCDWCGLNTGENDYGTFLNWDGTWVFGNQWIQRPHILEQVCTDTPPTDCTTWIDGYQMLGTFNDHTYYLSENKLSWEQAKISSEAQGGYLVSLNNQEENDFVQAHIDEMVFIGYHDNNTEGFPEWANGDAISLDLSSNNSEEADFAIMNFWAGTWSMHNQYVQKRFIMEMDCSIDNEQTYTRPKFEHTGIKLLSVHPIPANDRITLRLFANTTEAIQFSIINPQGQMKHQSKNHLGIGANELDFDISQLVPGVYFLKATGANIDQVLRFVKLRM